MADTVSATNINVAAVLAHKGNEVQTIDPRFDPANRPRGTTNRHSAGTSSESP